MAGKKATAPEPEHRRLDAYIRVSDTKGRSGESFISPKEQRERIEAWAKSQDHTITNLPADWKAPNGSGGWPAPGGPAIWEELDISGGTVNRPMLNEVMRRIETGETEGVVVSYLSRFGRTLIGTLELVKRIDEAGGLFASVSEGFDITTPHGRLVLNMMLSIAQFELERTSAQWESAKKRAIERGLHFPGTPPFGYRWKGGLTGSDDPAWNSDYSATLEPDPDTAPIVSELFARRASGHSITAVKGWLNEVAPGRTWSNTAVLRTLRRPTYLGRAYSGEYSKDDAHPPLVDRATWQAVQYTATPRGLGAGRATSLLHGLVRCASCRYAMVIAKSAKVANAYYRCNTDGCPHPSQITVTGPGSGRYAEKAGNDKGLDDFVARLAIERYPTVEGEEHAENTELERLEEAVRTANDELIGYAGDADIQREAGREAFLAGLVKRRARAEAAQAELADLLRVEGARAENVTNLEEQWPGMTMDERREVLAQVIQAVFVRPTVKHPRPLASMSPKQRLTAERGTGNGASDARVHVVWVEDPVVDVPRQGRRGFVRRPFAFPGSD